MANVTDWYGRNNSGWGQTYEVSHAGNVNESNNWGLIYPFNFDGSFLNSDNSLVTSDDTTLKSDATFF